MFWTILLTLFHLQGGQTIETFQFYKDTLCDLQARVSKKCSTEETGNARSLLSCIRRCAGKESCIGVSVTTDTTNDKCYTHQHCGGMDSCGTVETDHVYYSSYCGVGKWNTITSTCECPAGYHGNDCENVIRDCSGLSQNAVNQLTYIDPGQDGNVLRVYCYKSGSWWAIYPFRNMGSFDFDRTMDDYINGFFDTPSGAWGGLEAWHILSTYHGLNKLTVVLKFNAGNDVYHVYDNFVVSDSSHGYSFTFASSMTSAGVTSPGGYSFGDCFNPVKGLPFSTRDDNTDGGNCTSRAGCGWWHPVGCHVHCNILGRWSGDWSTIPVGQRLAVEGIDIEQLRLDIIEMQAYIESTS